MRNHVFYYGWKIKDLGDSCYATSRPIASLAKNYTLYILEKDKMEFCRNILDLGLVIHKKTNEAIFDPTELENCFAQEKLLYNKHIYISDEHKLKDFIEKSINHLSHLNNIIEKAELDEKLKSGLNGKIHTDLKEMSIQDFNKYLAEKTQKIKASENTKFDEFEMNSEKNCCKEIKTALERSKLNESMIQEIKHDETILLYNTDKIREINEEWKNELGDSISSKINYDESNSKIIDNESQPIINDSNIINQNDYNYSNINYSKLSTSLSMSNEKSYEKSGLIKTSNDETEALEQSNINRKLLNQYIDNLNKPKQEVSTRDKNDVKLGIEQYYNEQIRNIAEYASFDSNKDISFKLLISTFIDDQSSKFVRRTSVGNEQKVEFTDEERDKLARELHENYNTNHSYANSSTLENNELESIDIGNNTQSELNRSKLAQFLENTKSIEGIEHSSKSILDEEDELSDTFLLSTGNPNNSKLGKIVESYKQEKSPNKTLDISNTQQTGNSKLNDVQTNTLQDTFKDNESYEISDVHTNELNNDIDNNKTDKSIQVVYGDVTKTDSSHNTSLTNERSDRLNNKTNDKVEYTPEKILKEHSNKNLNWKNRNSENIETNSKFELIDGEKSYFNFFNENRNCDYTVTDKDKIQNPNTETTCNSVEKHTFTFKVGDGDKPKVESGRIEKISLDKKVQHLTSMVLQYLSSGSSHINVSKGDIEAKFIVNRFVEKLNEGETLGRKITCGVNDDLNTYMPKNESTIEKCLNDVVRDINGKDIVIVSKHNYKASNPNESFISQNRFNLFSKEKENSLNNDESKNLNTSMLKN